MKRFFFFLFWGLNATFHLQAQDWNLITPTSKLNFQASGADFVTTTILVTNTAASGTDSIFWMSPQKAVYTWNYPYIGLAGNILGDSIVKHSDGVYEFRFRPFADFSYLQQTSVIHAKAELGDSWTFEPGVTATVVAKTDTTIWGSPDSIKTLLLSDATSIRISKRFGLLFFKNQTLVGLEGENIGNQLPKLKEWYQDWVSGAVFEFSATNKTDYTNTVLTWDKYEVLDQIITADSLKILVRKLSRREQYWNGALGPVTFEDKAETLAFSNPGEVKYPGTVYKNGQYFSGNYSQTSEGLEYTFQNVTTPSSNGPSSVNKYVLGLGQTYNEFSYGGIGFYFSSTRRLTGYQKTGQTTQGTIHPDDFYKQSQDSGWKLLNPSDKLNFQANGADFISTSIQVTNATVSGADSIFWMSPQKVVYTSGYPYIGLVGNILGDSIVKHSDGAYECRFRPVTDFNHPQQTSTIKPNAAVGASWTFEPGITALVAAKKDTMLWGFQDSIKTINLSDGNIILLSKRFGVIYFKGHTLLGLEGKNIGVQLPKQKEWYQDWVAGAVFEESGSSTADFTSTVKTWFKYYVLDKTITSDNIKIKVRKLTRNESYYNYSLTSTTFGDQEETMTIPNPEAANYEPGTRKDAGSNIYYSTDYEQTADGLKVTIENVTTPSIGAFISDSYIIGLGHTNHYFASGSTGYSFSTSTALTGFQKVGQALQGTIHADTFYREIKPCEDLSIFPNPTAGTYINLNSERCSGIQTIECIDVNGQIVSTIDHPAAIQGIELEDLKSGLYLIRVRLEDDRVVVRKLVVW
jgi:hypothetical protein